MAQDARQWALWLAKRGFRICYLPPGRKLPPPSGWQQIRTTDPETIEGWFDRQPEMNYLVSPASNQAIIDLDPREHKDGTQAFAALELEHGEFPKTFTVQSPSGGVHYYLVHDLDRDVSNAHSFPQGSGIDVRGTEGWTVGPGSTTQDGEYTALNKVSPVAAPEWVKDYLKPAREQDDHRDDPMFEYDLPWAIERAREFLKQRAPAIEGHGGDAHTFATCVLLRDFCISEDKALDLLLEPGGWNERCEPPWAGAELATKVTNAYRYGKDRPGSKGGGLMEQVLPDDIVDVTELPEDDGQKAGDKFADLRQHLLRGQDIWVADTHQHYIIPEWFPDGGYTCLLSARGGGKTTVLLDIASRLALDMDWHGWPVADGYHVIYFCGEHDKVALQLLKSWREYNLGMDVAWSSRFLFLRHAGDLMSAEMTRRWAEFLRNEIGPHGKAITFLDTWQRATTHGSQNDDQDMQVATHHAEGLARYLGGPMMVAVHPPKADQGLVLGSSIIENNSTAILQLHDSAAGKQLEVTRMKGRGEGNKMFMKFEPVYLGEEDEFGREVTGQAVVKLGGTSPDTGEFEKGSDEATENVETSLEELRHILANMFMVVMREAPNDEAYHNKDMRRINHIVSVLDLVQNKSETEMKEWEQAVFEAGRNTLFSMPWHSKTLRNWIMECFVQPPRTSLVDSPHGQVEIAVAKKGKHYVVNHWQVDGD